MPQARELSAPECLTLLRRGVTGRIAISTPTGPHMVPVNYSVVDNAIVVRTSPHSRLGTYGRETMLAFEIAGVDAANERGWSVQARGRGEVVTDRDELASLRAVAEPQRWTGGRSLYLRLRWSELTGCGSDSDPMSDVVVESSV